MRLKEILRTATQAWSPAAHHPTYLALGTSAQQLDASFNTTSALEIFEMDFADPSLEMKLSGSITTTHRFHSLIWVNFGLGVGGSAGRLVGGSDNGTVTVYRPEGIMASLEDAIVGESNKHTGPVRALDYNPFQSNLLASGANDSEIYIWDLNNFSNPMTPGTKAQPLEDVSVVAWNRQVQHIMASASPSGKAVVWDLRKNEPIIKISDHSNRMHCSGMLWHPEVATQLVLASEDDRLPVIQMWDLRFATSPLKVLESHTRGILSISWSQADPELLLSSAKDNRILCWNPMTGEVIYELPTANQWCFDVQWCPRNPALLSAASFDGHISVYSVMGGSLSAQQLASVDKISASFDAMDPFGTGQVLPPLQVPQSPTQPTIIPPLKKPPKWVRRPVGARFAFGGKLITFENSKPPQQPSTQQLPGQVFVSQVTTETEFLQRSRELQVALETGSFTSFCQAKIRSADSESEQDVWRFLMVNFEDEARVKFLRLLGFSRDELERKISVCLGKNLQSNGHGVDCNDLAEKIQLLSAQQSDEYMAAGDPNSHGRSASPAEFFSQLPKEQPNFQIPVSADTDGLITQALLVGNFEGAVDLCLSDGRFAEAILLAISGGEELLKRTQQRYLAKQRNSVSKLISSVVTQNWRDIVHSCELENWKEALAALLTYAHPEEFAQLCDMLGMRLEAGGSEKQRLQACLCYICSGNIEKLVGCWNQHRDCTSPLALEDLVEKVMILQKSIERLRSEEVAVKSAILADKLTHYASLLASQGSLATAMSYLPASSDQRVIQILRDRLFHAQGERAQGPQPPCPYPKAQTRAAAPDHTPAAVTQNPQRPRGHHVPKQALYQPAMPSSTPDPVQGPVPTLFTPQAPEAMVPPPTTHGPTSARPGSRPMYPPHPATAPAFPPQLFHPPNAPASAPLGFMSGPPGPPVPPSSTSGNIPMMHNPGPPPPGFIPPSSIPSTPPAMPPNMLPGGPVPMFPSVPHSQGGMPPPPSGTYLPVGPGYPQGGPGAPAAKPFSGPAVPPPPTGYFPWLGSLCEDSGAQEGWNDPPAVRGGPRKKKLPENYTPPAPITAPVMSFSGEPAVPQEHVQVPPGAPQEPSVQLLQHLPTERVEQKDIPAEHQVLKHTFDSLVQRCQLAAGDPQTKRKLDDASKRLHHLYDKLREQALSPSILSGLHEISHCIGSRSYQRGLEVHTQVVTSSNFSEISAFMPILKVLMTIGNKLGV
ncbi:protein transport protein Sec31A isoform X2 [Denticeps clupeoides]|uniref:Protein transport protein Sec31A n=1 Tax=Denticeps clupeoides TaxID=299321 RepID=A0AAY3ZTF6_9TELE|nr:protein transport protein Sec31A-like isoform X2 [Denticeps clupeoides]